MESPPGVASTFPLLSCVLWSRASGSQIPSRGEKFWVGSGSKCVALMPPCHPCKGAGLLEEATVPVCLLRPHRSASSSFGACDSDASRGNVDIAVKHRLIESSTHVTAPWKHLCGTRACVVSVVRALSQGLPKVWLDVGRLPPGDCEHGQLWGWL